MEMKYPITIPMIYSEPMVDSDLIERSSMRQDCSGYVNVATIVRHSDDQK